MNYFCIIFFYLTKVILYIVMSAFVCTFTSLTEILQDMKSNRKENSTLSFDYTKKKSLAKILFVFASWRVNYKINRNFLKLTKINFIFFDSGNQIKITNNNRMFFFLLKLLNIYIYIYTYIIIYPTSPYDVTHCQLHKKNSKRIKQKFLSFFSPSKVIFPSLFYFQFTLFEFIISFFHIWYLAMSMLISLLFSFCL